MRSFALFLSVVSALVATGCSRSAASDPSHPETVAAATYKEGRGLQLTDLARTTIGLRTGEVSARDVAMAKAVPAIPRDALLRTVKGDFAYVANGEWLLRTPVTVGVTDGEWLEVKEGLYEGDVVVTHGLRLLWLAELQAINGGVGCADDN